MRETPHLGAKGEREAEHLWVSGTGTPGCLPGCAGAIAGGLTSPPTRGPVGRAASPHFCPQRLHLAQAEAEAAAGLQGAPTQVPPHPAGLSSLST